MRVWLVTGALGLALAGCAGASGPDAGRYLAKGVYDGRKAVSPPPAHGSPLAEQDRAVFIGRDLDEAALKAGFEACAA